MQILLFRQPSVFGIPYLLILGAKLISLIFAEKSGSVTFETCGALTSCKISEKTLFNQLIAFSIIIFDEI